MNRIRADRQAESFQEAFRHILLFSNNMCISHRRVEESKSILLNFDLSRPMLGKRSSNAFETLYL